MSVIWEMETRVYNKCRRYTVQGVLGDESKVMESGLFLV